MNNVNLVGRLTKDPELRFVGDLQTPVVDITIAINRKNKNQDNNVDFIPVQIWNKQAENCEKYLRKGDLVGITGEIRIDKYKNKDGETKYVTKVKATTIKFLSSKRNEETTSKHYNSDSLFEQAKGEDIDKIELPF